MFALDIKLLSCQSEVILQCTLLLEMDYRDRGEFGIYQKSLAVCDLSTAISAYFAAETKRLKLNRIAPLRHEIAMSLIDDAKLIRKSVADTLNSKSREQRVRQLSLINIRLKNLLSYCNGLEMDGVKEKEYINLLRNEIKSFRRTFKAWRKSILSL